MNSNREVKVLYKNLNKDAMKPKVPPHRHPNGNLGASAMNTCWTDGSLYTTGRSLLGGLLTE